MTLDIRLPIGLLFTLLGLLLAVFGLVSDPAVYQHSLGYNMNLIWGIVLLAFGSPHGGLIDIPISFFLKTSCTWRRTSLLISGLWLRSLSTCPSYSVSSEICGIPSG